MKKISILSALLATAGLVSSCSSDEDITGTQSPSSALMNEIAFSAEHPNDKSAVSRASGTTATSLEEFAVTCLNADNSIFFANEGFKYDAGTFKSTTPHYWPLSTTLSFFAINDQFGDKYDVDNKPLYEVSNWAGEKDLLTAAVVGGTKLLPYPLSFKHVLSQVAISAEAEDKTEELTYKLVSVEMETPCDGTYNFANTTGGVGSWSIDNSSKKVYAYGDVLPLSFSQNSSVTSGSTYWNILPVSDGIISFKVGYQVYQNGKMVKDYTGDNVKTCEVQSPSLVSGKKYVYNFLLSHDSKDVIEFTTSILNWDEAEVKDMNLSQPWSKKNLIYKGDELVGEIEGATLYSWCEQWQNNDNVWFYSAGSINNLDIKDFDKFVIGEDCTSLLYGFMFGPTESFNGYVNQVGFFAKVTFDTTPANLGKYTYVSYLKEISIPKSIKKIPRCFLRFTDVHTINYQGTKEEWNAIQKGANWEPNGSYTVHCSDGDIAS